MENRRKSKNDPEDTISLFMHRYPREEMQFYISVVKGDVEAVRENCLNNRFMDQEGVGVLSRDPLTNIRYHFVITAAMLTRLCMENGMNWELAFILSDTHIQRLDDTKTINDVQKLHDNMVLDFTRRMQLINKKNNYCVHVNVCKNYIHTHINERITVDDIATEIGVSCSYLSRLFKKETGQSISDYIRKEKIDQAMNLLRYSDFPVVDISTRLAFSSQSHFIQQFRECTGMTPKKYRDTYYMKVWDIDLGEPPMGEIPAETAPSADTES